MPGRDSFSSWLQGGHSSSAANKESSTGHKVTSKRSTRYRGFNQHALHQSAPCPATRVFWTYLAFAFFPLSPSLCSILPTTPPGRSAYRTVLTVVRDLSLRFHSPSRDAPQTHCSSLRLLSAQPARPRAVLLFISGGPPDARSSFCLHLWSPGRQLGRRCICFASPHYPSSRLYSGKPRIYGRGRPSPPQQSRISPSSTFSPSPPPSALRSLTIPCERAFIPPDPRYKALQFTSGILGCDPAVRGSRRRSFPSTSAMRASTQHMFQAVVVVRPPNTCSLLALSIAATPPRPFQPGRYRCYICLLQTTRCFRYEDAHYAATGRQNPAFSGAAFVPDLTLFRPSLASNLESAEPYTAAVARALPARTPTPAFLLR
jgi:hypothetical protein